VSAASYFVYYKIRAARLEELRRLVEKLFAAVERETGVRGRWMHRRDDPGTYMEVYENVREAARFETLLEQQVSRLGISRCLAVDAARRTEIFVDAPMGDAGCA
jgi:hypothetical protein